MIPSASLKLSIQQQSARLGLEIEKPQQSIRQPRAELKITQTPAKMELTAGVGEFQFDSDEFWAGLGTKSPFRMTAEIAAQARQVALEAVGQLAEEGDQLAEIPNGPTFADIALQRQNQGPMPIQDFGPPAKIRMNFRPHPFNIEWKLGGAEIDAEVRKPEIDYRPGKVSTYIEQQNWLSIDVQGQYMNQTF